MVPWLAVNAYATQMELDEEQREMLFDIIREVDAWYMDRKAKQEAKGGKKANKKGLKGKADGK